MRRFCVKSARVMLAGAAAAAVWGGPGAYGQTQLPGIVVTPSPVAKRRPAAPSPTPAPAAPEAPSPFPGAGVPVEDTFVPLTVVPTEQIAGTPGATLTDSLQTKPGIIGSTFAPGRQPADHPRARQLSCPGPGERHRLARRVGAERGPRGPHRSARHRPYRGGARPGDAALRLAGHRRRRSTPSTAASPRSFRRRASASPRAAA